MATLRIPDKHKTVFLGLKDLSDQAVDELVSLLSQTDQELDTDKLIAHVAANSKCISLDQARDITESILVLYFLMGTTNKATVDIVNDVLTAISRTTADEVSIGKNDGKRIRERLSRLLAIPSVSRNIKAIGILYEHERNFTDVRVITDIRPIFGTDLDSSLSGAVVVHMVKLGYIKDRKRREFFIALNNQDIDTVIEKLKRAKTKAKHLQTIINNADIPYLEERYES